jgi:hypothetical protein
MRRDESQDDLKDEARDEQRTQVSVAEREADDRAARIHSGHASLLPDMTSIANGTPRTHG